MKLKDTVCLFGCHATVDSSQVGGLKMMELLHIEGTSMERGDNLNMDPFAV